MSAAPAPAKKKKASPRRSRAYVQAAIEIMARARTEKGQCMFAFTAPHRKAGTSYIVNLLAEELAGQFDATVAVVPAEALKGCEPKRLPKGFTEQSANLWTAVPDSSLANMPDFALENLWISPGNDSFDFILIDCPALDASPAALRWGAEVDGVLMIVQAGVTRIDQIETSQRLMHSSAAHLAGMILNQRTYPIPKFLYKLL